MVCTCKALVWLLSVLFIAAIVVPIALQQQLKSEAPLNLFDSKVNEGYNLEGLSLGAPSPPSNLNADSGDGYVYLTWDAPSDDGGSEILGYKVYRNGAPIATVPATQLWYNDTDVTNGIPYTYYVTAVNAVGESTPSNAVYAIPGGVVPELNHAWLAVIIALFFLLILKRKKIF